MNIDITTILPGGSGGKPLRGKLTTEDFSMTLDEQLAQLMLLVPGDEPHVQKTIIEFENNDGVGPSVSQHNMAFGDLSICSEEESPRWYLQQLVVNNSRTVGDVKTNPMSERVVASVPVSLENDELEPAITVGKKSPQLGELFPPKEVVDRVTGPNTTSAYIQSETRSDKAVDMTVTETMDSITTHTATFQPTSRTGFNIPQQVERVHYPVDTQEWKSTVSQHIAMFSRANMHSAEIRLHPEELGSLHITLRVQQDQAQIHIISEHPHVRNAMEQAIPFLRTAMAESGVQLEQASVSADHPHAGGGEQRDSTENKQNENQGRGDVIMEEEITPIPLTSYANNNYEINTFV